ncbi:PREDICTED: uncharacterized protein LOC109581721 [Amphimedon queenslandica]|uniref:Uncharacterized protein n=1 Tax=Amphimedon queenslandica TaxID=400682 RepID=A0A1X7UYU3_AMPQE|nr:PREDICTED: uncharacterized protein LOC109581721 [Amphimedon queenslandica]|eukprot:XP_019851638.1 PREDICTED: uncharacterized protein LOC109581721 [Amphimedon queenslandica]
MAFGMEARPTCTSFSFNILRQHSQALFGAINVTEPIPIAWSLYSKGIIEKCTLDKVQAFGIPRYLQISGLLEGVLSSVESKPDLLQVTLDALESNSSPAIATVVDQIRLKLSFNVERMRDENSLSPGRRRRKPKNIVIPVDSSVHKDLMQFNLKFGGFFYKVRKSISEEVQSSYLKIQDLKDYLSCYSPHLSPKLESEDFFTILRSLSSPTNTLVLESMADHFQLVQTSDLIQSYHREEEVFKMKLLDKDFARELQEEMSRFEPDSEIQINLKLQWHCYDDMTVKEFRDLLNEIFSSNSRYIHLLQVKKGCVHCVCRAPLVLQEVLVTLARDRLEWLVDKGIGLFSIGGVSIIEEKVVENGVNHDNESLGKQKSVPTQKPTVPVTIETTQPLPQEVIDLLNQYLSHNSCHGNPSTCMSCCKIDRTARRLLSTYTIKQDNEIDGALDEKSHLWVSPDQGLGQSLTKGMTEGERERKEEEGEGNDAESSQSISIFSIPQTVRDNMLNEEERERLEPKISLKETGGCTHKMEERGLKKDKKQEAATITDSNTMAAGSFQSQSVTDPTLSSRDSNNVTIPTQIESTSTSYDDQPVVTPMSPPLYSSHPTFVRRSSSNYDSGIVLGPPSDETGDKVGGVDEKVGVADAYRVIEREESGRRHEILSQIKEEK